MTSLVLHFVVVVLSQIAKRADCQDICGTCQNICYCKLTYPLTKRTVFIIGQIQDVFNTSRNQNSSLALKPCKFVQETSEEVLFITARQIARQMYLLRFNIQFSTILDRSYIYRELRNSDFQIYFSRVSKLFVQGFFSHNPRHI